MSQDIKKNGNEVKEITNMDEDFAQWYTDVCKKAELIDYSSIKGIYIYIGRMDMQYGRIYKNY